MHRLNEAVAAYSAATRINQNYVQAHSNLGNLLTELGFLDKAIASCCTAIHLAPDFADAYSNLGNALTSKGLSEKAVAASRVAICLRPDRAEAQYNLALIMADLGRREDTVTLCRRATIVRSDCSEAQFTMAAALADLGKLDDAVAAYLAAIRINHELVEAYSNLGNALKNLGRSKDAADAYRSALCLGPDFAETFSNLGSASKELGQLDAAAVACGVAIHIKPDFAPAYSNLGSAWRNLGRLDDAIAVLHRSLALQPETAEVHDNLGNALLDLGLAAEAVLAYKRAYAISPENGLLSAKVANGLFCLGRLAEAWTAYEHRPLPPAPLAIARWTGNTDAAKTLFIWNEQGIADQVLAVSMLPEAAQKVAAVVLQSDRRLVSLFQRSFPRITVVPQSDRLHPQAEQADLQIPLFSLGHYFRRCPAEFPQHSGYLQPDPVRVAHWRSWLKTLGPGPKVGISWRSINPEDRSEYLPSLEQLRPTLALSGLTLVNLQYGHAEDEIEALYRRTGLRIHLAEGLNVTDDLDDVAALSFALDAVAGFSSASAILAGAVGTPSLIYMCYPGSHGNRIFGLDYMPWLPDAQIIFYNRRQDLGTLVDQFTDHLARFLAKGSIK